MSGKAVFNDLDFKLTIEEAMNRVMDAFRSIDQQKFNPDGKQGGFLAVLARYSGVLLHLGDYGEVVRHKAKKYVEFASVVKPNMLRYNASIMKSSEAQNSDLELWGGAISIRVFKEDHPVLFEMLCTFSDGKYAEEIVLSFSGLPAKGDEGAMICLPYVLGLIERESALAYCGENETALAMLEELDK